MVVNHICTYTSLLTFSLYSGLFPKELLVIGNHFKLSSARRINFGFDSHVSTEVNTNRKVNDGKLQFRADSELR
jgi:hypothetical protein